MKTIVVILSLLVSFSSFANVETKLPQRILCEELTEALKTTLPQYDTIVINELSCSIQKCTFNDYNYVYTATGSLAQILYNSLAKYAQKKQDSYFLREFVIGRLACEAMVPQKFND